MDSISLIKIPQITPKEAPALQQKATESNSGEIKVRKISDLYKGDIAREALPQEEAMRMTREYSRRADTARSNINETTFDMRRVYTDVQVDLIDKKPELLKKDWDFTVDSKGELMIVEGKDSLSKKEVETITDILKEHGVDEYMKFLAENIVERGVASRGPEKWMSERGIGSFDITMDNMSNVLRGRELMHETKVRYVNTGPSDLLMQVSLYNENKSNPMNAIMQQLYSRAEIMYEYEPGDTD